MRDGDAVAHLVAGHVERDQRRERVLPSPYVMQKQASFQKAFS